MPPSMARVSRLRARPLQLGTSSMAALCSDRCFVEDAKNLLDRLPEGHCERAKDQNVPGLGIGRGGRGCAPPKKTRSQAHDKGLICAHVSSRLGTVANGTG